MLYQLLITGSLRTDDEAYAGYLMPGEVVRGVPFALIIGLENIGDEAFPGSESLRVSLEVGSLTVTLDLSQHPEIPELPPGASTQLEFDDLTLSAEGLGSIYLTADAIDAEPIEFRLSRLARPGEPSIPGADYIRLPVFVVNRELVRLLRATEER